MGKSMETRKSPSPCNSVAMSYRSLWTQPIPSAKIGYRIGWHDWMTGTIYLDYAATTPVDPAVVDSMVAYMGPSGVFGNPASSKHILGQEAGKAVEGARESVAELIEAAPDEIVWTSGATESINLAIKGVAQACRPRGRHIVTSSLEHSATIDTCRHLASKGFQVTLLRPDSSGIITPELVAEALRDETILVSLMHVNNETGTLTNIGAIGELTREKGIAFHVDAVQSAARLQLYAEETNADFMSFTAHKMYGPKGIGALYVHRKFAPKIAPLIHGGNKDLGLRAGTLATHQIVGMGKAAELLSRCRERDITKTAGIEEELLKKLAEIPDAHMNSVPPRVAGIANVRFDSVDNESLLISIREEIAISSGSACTSTRVEPSHVLLGLGLSEAEANSSVRISLGRFTTKSEVERAAVRIKEAVTELRMISCAQKHPMEKVQRHPAHWDGSEKSTNRGISL